MEIFEELEYVGDTDNVLYGSLTGMVFKVTTRVSFIFLIFHICTFVRD